MGFARQYGKTRFWPFVPLAGESLLPSATFNEKGCFSF
jgi:hypothetical protein